MGRAAAGRSLLEAGASIAQTVGDGSGLARALTNLGAAAHADGDLVAACALLEEGVSVARATGDRHRLGLALAGLALVDRLQGRHAESAARCKEALVVSSELEDAMVLPRSLAGMASVATLEGAHGRAARLFGKAQALRETSGTRDTPQRRAIAERDLADLRAELGDAAFAAAWAEGRAMSLARPSRKRWPRQTPARARRTLRSLEARNASHPASTRSRS